MITKTLSRRLERLEEQMSPNAEPIIIDVVFVDAATMQRRPGFQVKIPMSGYAREGRRPTLRFGDRGR
jgi:hypothetical protein